jgi:hypothetical protein
VDGFPRERIFYELYRDQGAFSDHQAQPHIRRFMTEREALLEAPQVDFLDVSDGKLPPASPRGRTSFGSGSTDLPDE